MALIGYDPKKRSSKQMPARTARPVARMAEQTIMTSRADLPQIRPPRALRLVPLIGGGLSRTFVVREPETILGRQTGAGLRIWDNKVSRQHCKIILGEQAATLVDLDSSNGTFLNDEQIDQGDLRDGDLVRLGDTVLRVRYMDFVEQRAADDAYWLATRDPGTELYNRQYVLEALQREVVRAGHRGQALSLVLVSVDLPGVPSESRLSLIDKELRTLGSILQREGGEDILVGRYSTSEVVALMPMCGAEAAAALGERIKQQRRETATDPKAPADLFFGMAAFPEVADSAEQLIERAEIALYQARTGAAASA